MHTAVVSGQDSELPHRQLAIGDKGWAAELPVASTSAMAKGCFAKANVSFSPAEALC